MAELRTKIDEANAQLKEMKAQVKTMTAREMQRIERLEIDGQALQRDGADAEEEEDGGEGGEEAGDEEVQEAAAADGPPAKRRLTSKMRVTQRPNPAPFNK